MKKARVLLRWMVIVITVIMVSTYLAGIGGSAIEKEPMDALEARADIIPIDSMKVFGKLERRPVTFLHQKHTEALEKKNKDCTTCHLSEKNRMSAKYMRIQDTTRQEVMDVYHTNCIACHRETAAAIAR